MKDPILAGAIEKLSRDFDAIQWQYLDVPPGSPREKTQLWPGLPTEDVMICVYKGTKLSELFHRQDFFFFNFAYQGDYSALSYLSDNQVSVHEGECYIGQPSAGYAINDGGGDETIIIGVLIQTEAFFRYIGEHIDTVTLQDVARHFSYHPNYISSLLPKEIGKTFSEILLEQRMERAAALLDGTSLPISEVARLLGYSNSSNFYKAFREYYGISPGECQKKTDPL
ncbi:MAG: helix-turn-helix transcriptional regulator [Clostridiales bacterium]|nr:helix-turn-helix transcriptional regulator [Clostridiales bacterium]